MKSTPFFLFLMIATIIFGMRYTQAEELVTFDGQIAKAKLPLDKQVAKKKYETAIFGIG